MKRKIVVFEKLKKTGLLPVLWYVLRGYDVCYLGTDPGTAGTWWFRRFTASKRLSQLSLPKPPFDNNYPANHLAFKVVEQIYEDRYQNNPLIRRLVKLFESQDLHLGYKKALTKELWEYIFQHLLAGQVGQAFPDAGRVIYISHDAHYSKVPQAYLEHLSRLKEWTGNGNVAPSSWQRVRRPTASVTRGTRTSLIGIRALVFAAVNFLGPSRQTPQPGEYAYAISIINVRRAFANDVRGADFLLDGIDIRTDNTLFIPYQELCPEHVKRAEEKGLKIVDASIMPTWRICLKWAVVQVSLLTRYALSPSWIRGASASMIKTHLFWSAFLGRYKVEHFVTYADFMIPQVARNILLNQDGCTTWYYLDSLNTEYHLLNEGEATVRQWAWGFLLYDHCVTWNQLHVDSFKFHGQQIGNYASVGCIWSEHILQLRKEPGSGSFLRELEAEGRGPDQLVVTFFDSSYNNGSRNSYREGNMFLDDIQRLLEKYPDIFIVLKEKLARDRLGQFGNYLDANTHGMIERLERLENHPRCYLPGYQSSAAEAIAASDLTVSYSFSSTTLEALGAGVKAVFYSPAEYDTQSSYDRIPDLVVNGYEELEARVGELLYETSTEEYQEYLDANIKDTLDPYLDGLGLTRFRKLLTASESPPTEISESVPVGQGSA